jgi:alkylhydroperoxidase family enzyme
MAWIQVIPPGEASGDLAAHYSRMCEPDGSVDNILTVHSLNPRSLLAHYDLYKVCMYGPSDLSRAQREMVAVVVSVINHCDY